MRKRSSVYTYTVEHMRGCLCFGGSHGYALDKVVMQDARTLPIFAEIAHGPMPIRGHA